MYQFVENELCCFYKISVMEYCIWLLQNAHYSKLKYISKGFKPQSPKAKRLPNLALSVESIFQVEQSVNTQNATWNSSSWKHSCDLKPTFIHVHFLHYKVKCRLHSFSSLFLFGLGFIAHIYISINWAFTVQVPTRYRNSDHTYQSWTNLLEIVFGSQKNWFKPHF